MCTSPLQAYRTKSGAIVFKSPLTGGEFLYLPCGQCIECRLKRSREWAVRCMHEARLWPSNCFITLTYEVVPEDGNLRYKHFQDFMKRIRKHFNASDSNPIRFYMCGEYGSITERPHYHAILFNCDFPDKVFHKNSGSGFPIYTSELLDKKWGFGHCWIGDVTFESAAYIARYVVDKLTGEAIERDGEYVIDKSSGEVYIPEFTRMSLKPGIGAEFYKRFPTDIFPHDRVILKGQSVGVPRYYSILLERENPELLERLKVARKSRIKWDETTTDRERARDVVAKARLAMLKRFDI